MNVVLVTVDSLAVRWLEPYGRRVELPLEVPSLARLAARGAQFDRHWAGSLPCMPARREFLAGTTEFLWRPWGPAEPFDVLVPRAARAAGARTALVTDHYHLFQHGGRGYHEDFDSWELVRGHELDAWRRAPLAPDASLLRQLGAPDVAEPGPFDRHRYARNVAGLEHEEDFFAAKVFTAAASAVRELAPGGPFFLYVDSFDVHEPFHVPQPYASLFTDEDPRDPELPVWPGYGRADALTPRQLAFLRSQYAAKVALVDRWLGHLLDTLDELRLWETTTVVLTSDHGHLLGEHGLVGKPFEPVWDELARTPLWIAAPGVPAGRRVDALTTAVDVQATLLEALGAGAAAGPHSRSLLPLARGETATHRDVALYGWYGGAVNATDGRFTYLVPGRDGAPLPCVSAHWLAADGRASWFDVPPPPADPELGAFLPWTDAPVLRYPGASRAQGERPLLFDTDADPDQQHDLAGTPDEARMRALLLAELDRLGAPPEQASRLLEPRPNRLPQRRDVL